VSQVSPQAVANNRKAPKRAGKRNNFLLMFGKFCVSCLKISFQGAKVMKTLDMKCLDDISGRSNVNFKILLGNKTLGRVFLVHD